VLQVEVFFEKNAIFLGGIRRRSKKFPDSKGDARGNARHFLDSSGYAQGGEAVFGGIWKVKKTPSYLRRQEGESLNLHLNFFLMKIEAIFPDSRI
jgi:hypothetical protein